MGKSTTTQPFSSSRYPRAAYITDRTREASLYARAGIADYWIVNLVDNQLEVRRDPRPDPSQHYGHGYASAAMLVPAAVVTPLAAPQVSLAIADLLL